jgi:hypothetical protein
MLKLAALVVSTPLLVAEVFLGPVIGVVEVRESRECARLLIPFPIVLAQAAPIFLPEEVRVPLDRRGPEHFSPAQAAGAGRVLSTLRQSPNAELVRITAPDETVSIRKEGDRLKVDVRTGHEKVRVTIPMRMAMELLEGAQRGALEPADLTAALRRLPRGKLVHVRDGEAEVKVWVF